MHEIPQIDQRINHTESSAQKGRRHSRCMGRHQDCGSLVAAFRMEVDGNKPALWCKSASGRRLDSQSQQPWCGQRRGRTSPWTPGADDARSAAAAGRSLDEVAGGVWPEANAMGRYRGRGVPAQGLRHRIETAPGTQLAEAPGLRFEAARISIYPSDRGRRGRVPARAQKKLHRILKLGELALLVFADESGFSQHPKLGRIWARRGGQPIVPTTSQHAKRLNLFGWVDPLYGWHGLFRRPKGNREGFIAFLKYLCNRVKGWKVYLYVDGASWHKGDEVREFLATHPEIHMEYLPPYHPELNPQERVWHLIRYEVTTNRYHPTVELIEQAIRNAQRRWKPNKIRSLCQVI
jgi:transposase